MPIDFQHLETYTLADRELEREILDLFASQATSLMTQLTECGDDQSWAYASHSLKGCARAVGAWKVGQLAAELEAMGGPGAASDHRLAALDRAVAEAVAFAAQPR